MIRSLWACILVTAASLVYAQKPPVKFGDVSLDEVKMTSFPNDSSATAAVLFDYGVSEVVYSSADSWFQLHFERTTRIKILKKDGYSFADFEVPLYHNSSGKEKLTGLKVITYNFENGKVVETKLKSDGIFTEKYDQNTDIIKFTAPNVKEGSVIEVNYKVISDFLSYFRDWEFQSTIPVAWSEYRAYIPEYFNYDKYMQGYVGLYINETKEAPKSILINSKERSTDPRTKVSSTQYQSDKIEYKEMQYRWVAKDAPAFREEPFMTSSHDYLSKINFELTYYKLPNRPIENIVGTWQDLNKSFLESPYFGDVVSGSGFLKKTTDEVTAGLSTPEEKISAIYSYVKSNLEWDGSNRKFVSDVSLKDALENKKGNSAHINLMLTSMLQKAGINASPVILSTRSNGFVRENMALSSQFNYVICMAIFNDKKILLDATDRLLPIGILPERCLNGRGYAISNQNPGWVDLVAPKSRTGGASKLTLSSNGEFTGELKITSDGYYGRKSRNSFLTLGESEYLKSFQTGKDFQITKAEFQHTHKLDKPLEEKYDIKLEAVEGAPGTLYFSP
nr:transglutaminase-like domain-containing protein [Cyclobacteriaceae bacterium]